MRSCPNCGHEFDDRELDRPNCPSCGREFTVTDIGAATIDFGTVGSVDLSEQEPRSAPTVIEKGPNSLLTPSQSDSVPVDGTGMTLQSGRWSPSVEDLEDMKSSPDLLKTIDSSFLGPAGSALMQTLESGFISGAQSGMMQTLESGFISGDQ